MEKINFFKSRMFLIVAVCLAELLLLGLVFRAGMVVGFNKAGYSFRWEENYERMFGGPGGMMRPGGMAGFGRDFRDGRFMPGHGVTGSVLKIDGNTIIIKTVDNFEKSLVVSSSTPIRKANVDITVKELHENDRVVAIGSPSSTGEIEVKFLRVLTPLQ